MGGNRALSFIGEMNCPSESDQILHRFGFFVRFSSGGETAAALLVSLVTVTYVSRYRSLLSPSVVDPLSPLSYLMTPSPC
jgi:hypothetical protein